MRPAIWIPVTLLVALAAGTIADRPHERVPMRAGEFYVLSGDFHLHPGLGSGGTMTPWGLVNEAQRQNLDVIAVTAHNSAWEGRVARAFSRLVNGPIVLAGEEVTSRTQDLIVVGIQSVISPRLPLIDQIAEAHRQGGIAIAAHPIEVFHDAYRSTGATKLIDGTEICHPVVYERAGAVSELAAFAAGTAATPIGSSDFHASGRVGTCRTFLFVREPTERGVLDALREHRTVVYGDRGQVFGDAALVQLGNGLGLRDQAVSYTQARGSVLDWISRLAAGAALLGVALVTRPRAIHRGGAGRESDRRARAQFP